MDKLRKGKEKFIKAIKWLLKEWVKALLAALAISFLAFLGCIFRTYIGNWLATKHSIVMFGWLWILGAFLFVSILVLTLWLFVRRKILYKDEGDIKIALEEQLERLAQGKNDTIRIDYRIWDRKLSLKKGSAAKLLPSIIENDSIFCIKSKGEDTIVVQRKGLTIQVGPDHPGGRLL